MWRRSRTGLAVASTVLTLSTPLALSAGPRSLWRHAIPGWGEPAASGALVYVLSQSHDVLAIDGSSGAVRWRSRTGGAGGVPWGSVVRVAGRHVVVGDGDVVAFDRDSGAERWRFAPGGAAGVYLGAADDDLVLTGSLAGSVHAVDAASGAPRWSRRLAPDAAVAFAPAVSGRAVVVTHASLRSELRGGVVVLDRRGRVRWRHDFEPGVAVAGPPVATATLAIVARTDGEIVAFDLRTGRQRRCWPKAAPTALWRNAGRDARALVVVGHILVAGSMSGDLVAYDVRTGAERWRYDSGPDGAPLRLRALADAVVAPYTNGTVVALDAATGSERWRIGHPRSPIEWSPARAAGVVVASGSAAIEGWQVELPPPAFEVAR
jgi:outer membrane protein assembly factor BamB